MADNDNQGLVMSNSELVDAFGDACRATSAAEKRRDVIRAVLLQRGVPDGTEGRVYKLCVTKSERESLDQKLLKEKMGVAWVAKFLKSSAVVSVKAAVRDDVAADLVRGAA